MESPIKKTLKNLCCSNGWSYGVFWRFDQRNSMLLTLEDAYYEEQMGVVIDNMLLQVHMLGEGIIGQTAFTGKHRWMFSDAYSGEGNFLGSYESHDIFQDNSEIRHQFSSGIKTIAIISVERQGVVQFGSTQKILERLEFLDQARRVFRDMENVDGLVSESAPSSLNIGSYDSSGLLASLISADNSNHGSLKPLQSDNIKELMRTALASTDFAVSSPFTPETLHGRIPPLRISSHQENQLHLIGMEAQTPCCSTWSVEGSSLTSIEQPFPSEMVQRSPYVFLTKPETHLSCSNTVQSLPGNSMFDSFCNTEGLIDMDTTIQQTSKQLMNQHSVPFRSHEGELLGTSSSMLTFQEEFKPNRSTSALDKTYQVDDIFQWLAPSPVQRFNGLTTSDDLSQAIGASLITSTLNRADAFIETPANHPANLLQSSVTNTTKAEGKDNSLNATAPENNLFDCLGVEVGYGKVGEIWKNTAMPVVSGVRSTVSIDISGTSESNVGSMTGPRKGLFSELGLEQLLDEIVGNSSPVCKSSFEDQQSTTKRRKTGSYYVHGSQNQIPGISCFGGHTKSMQPVYDLAKTKNVGLQKEIVPKSQVGSWIDDSYSISTGSAVIAQPKRPEEPAKAIKKRARPGESTRPRPKDRQQIQDRLGELRKIIPNTGKCSIDSLLDLTIKHMIFLQSMAKYAEKLKQVDEPKLIGQDNGVILKDNPSAHGGGATWAFEVGGQTMVCPIIVEDLSPPGQMLIEMLCEERGLFLEIADIVRGFGLNILKGVMEIRENKIWARFIVEASRQVTRIDIFWSLVQLLQQTSTTGIDSTNQPSNSIDDKAPVFNIYEQLPVLQQPISLGDTHR